MTGLPDPAVDPSTIGLVRELIIDGRRIADDTGCFVIAELGHNHQGSVERAQQLFVRRPRLRRRRRQAAEARQPHPLHARAVRRPLRQREQLRRHLRRPPRGAGARSRRLRGAAGVRAGARPRLLRDRVRRAERRPARGARHARLQDRLRRPAQHAAAPARGLARQADDRLDRRRHDRGRRPRRRDGAAAQHPGLPAAVHRVVPGRRRGAQPAGDRHPARALPGARRRALRPPGRDRDVARRLHARRARDREALHAQPHAEGHRSRLLAHAGGDAQAGPRPRAGAGRGRRRRQAAAADRGAAPAEDGEAARRRTRAAGRARARARTISRSSRRPATGCRPTSSTRSSAAPRPAARPDQAVTADDLAPAEDAAA